MNDAELTCLLALSDFLCFVYKTPKRQPKQFRRAMIDKVDWLLSQLGDDIHIQTMVIACMDEWIGLLRPNWRVYWQSHSMQLHYTKKIDAGKDAYYYFTKRLTERNPVDVTVVIYAIFYLLGYKGQYQLATLQEYQQMRSSCRQIIEQSFPIAVCTASRRTWKFNWRYRALAIVFSAFAFLSYLLTTIFSHWYLSWLE